LLFINLSSIITKADTKYPLIVVEDPNDKYGVILDGNHRFAKLFMQKVEKIKIKYITIKEFRSLI